MLLRRPLIAVCFVCVAPAFAQGLGDAPLSEVNGQLALDALGQRLVMPMPDWAEGATTLVELSDRALARYTEADGQAQLEMYRAGENEKFWTTLYGARLSTRASMSLQDFRSSVINVYAQGCDPDTIALFQLEADVGDVLPPLGYVCGAYADHIIDFVGEGEVMIMGFYRSEVGIGMVYQEWRTPRFDAAKTETWPISPDEIEQRITQLKEQVSLLRAD
jgi:hypothetical protein